MVKEMQNRLPYWMCWSDGKGNAEQTSLLDVLVRWSRKCRTDFLIGCASQMVKEMQNRLPYWMCWSDGKGNAEQTSLSDVLVRW